ncbi:MAG: hypothetical protein IJX51_06835 [Clostridia bacterium]|nr:hypothetical protein [Clostridia bacterium]
MKRIIAIAFILLMIFSVGCDDTIYHWNFEYDYTEVVEISIIEAIGPTNNKGPMEYEVLAQLDLSVAEDLMKDIENIEYKKYAFNPADITGLCFLIEFNNGSYDIISYREPMHFIYTGDNDEINGYFSYFECDKEIFDEIINKYLTQTGDDSMSAKLYS